jgi:predicted nuclease of predicted toxin-antitoxin system
LKLVVDNQLPLALARWLAAHGDDAVHVLDLGLDRATDFEIWSHALRDGRIVVSKDEDFFHLANRPADDGRLLWVRVGNCRREALVALFERHRPSIVEAFDSGQRIVELR